MSTNLKILVTAGPTRESIDPVRYISNHSSGKMGYAIAAAAAKYTKDIFLISGPVAIEVPKDVYLFKVNSAIEMETSALSLYPRMDIVIMTAAVCDYRAASFSDNKIKKTGADTLTLTLVKNPDILASMGEKKEKQFLVGFAAETENLKANALEKLKNKNLDMIIANDVTKAGAGFGSDTNKVTIFSKDGDEKEFPLMPKKELAEEIMKYIFSKTNN